MERQRKIYDSFMLSHFWLDNSPLRAGPQQALLWASFQTYLLLLQLSDNIYVGTSGVASNAWGGGQLPNKTELIFFFYTSNFIIFINMLFPLIVFSFTITVVVFYLCITATGSKCSVEDECHETFHSVTFIVLENSHQI